MSNNTIFLLLFGLGAYYLYSQNQIKYQGVVTIPGSFEKEPGQPCPSTHFEVFVNNKTWCVPIGS